ncbi:MAG: hypothetical protein K0S48_4126 [Ramlibacter sp.]|nr:hypothetical protein [Ramlibacter sp.]
MMVATTKVTASVSSANNSPRTALTRKTTKPMNSPSSAGSKAAKGKVARNGQFHLPASTAVVYMPTPKKAPWPKEK